MSKYIGPKARLFRRVGIRLPTNREDNQKCATVKKNYPPGMHGPKGTFGKKSEYSRQLLEKQKAKFIFNITEKQFRKYFEQASKIEGVTGDELLKLLERRLDNVVFRAGIAKTRYQARQMVGHGLIELNGKRVTIPSIQVAVGDKFNLVDKKKDSPIFKENSEMKVNAPKWLEVDLKNLKGAVSRMPEKSELEAQIASNLIVEFYSK
ncbi:MAG: 30S ribosomal protein S4 [Candidatus Altimarinota bacterium]